MIARMLLAVMPAVALIVAAPTGAYAQAADAARGGTQSQKGAAVQIGAGSTSAVTTGNSGAAGSPGRTVPGAAAPFQITPSAHPFLGPGSLPIRPPRQLLCATIEDAAARARCAQRAEKLGRNPETGDSHAR